MGTQQFASGLTPIDEEKLDTIRQNTYDILALGKSEKKYKNQVNKVRSVIPANYGDYILLTIAGEGYFNAAYARLFAGTTAGYQHQFEVWVDGSMMFSGAWQSNGAYTGLATRENYMSRDGDNGIVLLEGAPSTILASGSLSRIDGIVGPNNTNSSFGPMVLLAQPIFFNSNLTLKVKQNQATEDTVDWLFLGAVKS